MTKNHENRKKQRQWNCPDCYYCDYESHVLGKPCCTFSGKVSFSKSGEVCKNHKQIEERY